MSRSLERQVRAAKARRGIDAPPAPPRRERTRQQRLNRILLIGGGLLALGAVALAVFTRPFDPMALGINLGAIALGLLMGTGVGTFMFRRILPSTHK